jgi:hypothetical protein
MNFYMKMGDGITATTAYDANGNIKRLQQWGLKLASSGQIDDLTYNYQDKSNKLLNIIDAYNDAQTKLGDFRVSAQNPTQSKTATRGMEKEIMSHVIGPLDSTAFNQELENRQIRLGLD